MKCFGLLLLILAAIHHPVTAQQIENLSGQTPVTVSGSVELRGTFYQADGIRARREPFSWLLTGSPTLSLYGISVPVSFTLSEQERSFRQPFNQFGMSPSYRWATVHAGYRNIVFSPYTLGGHTMLGGGFELKPGWLRLGFMAGRLNRATVLDTTTQALVPFSFSRKGIAARVGFGTDQNHFDIHFLRAEDDSSSVGAALTADSGVHPQANTVLGFGLKLRFLRYLSFESDGAVSVYTRDMNSPISLDSLGDPWLERIRSWAHVNGTSELNTAISAAVGYVQQGNGLKVIYKRIEPEFRSMGTYFFHSDLESWQLAPSMVIWQNKIRVNGSVGFQRDNIQRQKQATNNRITAAANASIQFIPEFGLDLTYSNFSNDQKARTALFADSMRIVQTTSTLGIMPRVVLMREQLQHVITASANIGSMRDFNHFLGEGGSSNDVNTRQLFLNYSITLVPRQLTLFANVHYTAMESAYLESKYTGISAGGNISVLESALQLGATVSVTGNGSGEDAFRTVNSSANATYRISQHHRARASVFLTNNAPKATSELARRFTESRAELSYQFIF